LRQAQKLIAQEPNRTQSSGWGAQQRTADADEHMWAMPNAHVILGA